MKSSSCVEVVKDTEQLLLSNFAEVGMNATTPVPATLTDLLRMLLRR